MRRRILIIVVVVLLVIVAGVALGHRGAQGVAVRETVVHYATFTTKLPETGVVQLPRIVIIPAGVPGNLGLISVSAGQRVSQGQLLASIINEQNSSNVRDAADAADSASGHAQSTAEVNLALPAQNRSSTVQAQAAVVAARSALEQAQQDLVAGAQSGLGYGAATAEEQRLNADTQLTKAQTDFNEAQRLFEADKYLYDQKGLSHDALLQSEAKFDEARASYEQAKSERQILGGQLTREQQVLRERLRSAQDGLRQAQAALASAQANAAESKAGDLEAARADAAHAQADLVFAQDQASRLQVRAPLDGIVESIATEATDSLRSLQPGDSVVAGQPLFTLAADEKFVVRTKVDEQDIAGVRLGQRAIVSGEDFSGATLDGVVVAISPIAQKSDDPSNTSRQIVTTIALRRKLPFLRDGMSVDVDIITRSVSHALSVPSDAVHKDGSGTYVYLDRSGHAHRSNVRTGPQNDSDTIILSGLHDGDRVVADKTTDLSENMAVKPAPSPSPGSSPGGP